MTRKKIAIFGGTFNPVHNGHIHLLQEYMKKISFDQIFIVPAKVPPHKEYHKSITNAQRFTMCKLAFQSVPGAVVSDIEFQFTDKSYTINTIREFRKQYPNDAFYIIIGSDMLFTFDKWHAYQEILKEVTLLAAARNQNEYKKMQDKATKLMKETDGKVEILDIIPLPLTSSAIRQKIKTGHTIVPYVPKAVTDYIEQQKLYQ